MRVLFFPSVLLLVVCSLLLFGCNQDSSNSTASDLTHNLISQELSLPMLAPGTKDDPYAAARYEWMRLHDPRTGQIPFGIRWRELAFSATLPTAESRAFFRSNAAVATLGPLRQLGPNFVGGRTRALGIDISGDYVLVGASSGGVFRMVDFNEPWVVTTTPNQNENVTCLAQDTRPGKTHIWYYGTGEMRSSGGGGGPLGNTMGSGIYKSVDSGKSWVHLTATQGDGPALFNHPFESAWNVVTNPTAEGDGEVYVAAFGGIMRSDDGGQTWDLVLGASEGNAARHSDVAVTSTGVLYAVLSNQGYNGQSLTLGANDHGIWRSEDGVNWSNITPSDAPNRFDRAVLATAPSDSSVLYVLASTPGTGLHNHQFWKYRWVEGDGTGNGGIWENRSANLPNDPLNDGSITDDYTSLDGWAMSLDVYPTDPDILFMGGTNLYRSNDGFATQENTTRIGGYRTTEYNWQFDPWASGYPGHHPDQHGIGFLPQFPGAAISITDGSVHVTNDALADTVGWAWIDDGYITSQFHSVAIDPFMSGDEMIVGGTQDNNVFVRPVSGSDFTALVSGDGSFAAVDKANRCFYTSTVGPFSPRLYRFTLNSQGNLDSAAGMLPEQAPSNEYNFLYPWRLDPANTKVLYLAVGTRLWRNSDVTEVPLRLTVSPTTPVNWTELENTYPGGFGNDGVPWYISAVGVSATPANVVYYGRNNGRVYRLENAGDENAVPVEVTGSNFYSGSIQCITVDPNNANNVVVVFGNYNIPSLFLTTDGGETWTDVGGNLEENPDGTGDGPACKWLERVEINGQSLYLLGTTTGLYSTPELQGAQTVWVREGVESIGTVPISNIATRNSDGRVVIATFGKGLYETAVTSSVQDNQDQGTDRSTDITLHRNWPDPFMDHTTIRFAIGEHLGARVPVRLELFDLQGKLVSIVRDEFLEPGEHRARITGDGLTSGVYMARLVVGSHIATRFLRVVK